MAPSNVGAELPAESLSRTPDKHETCVWHKLRRPPRQQPIRHEDDTHVVRCVGLIEASHLSEQVTVGVHGVPHDEYPRRIKGDPGKIADIIYRLARLRPSGR